MSSEESLEKAAESPLSTGAATGSNKVERTILRPYPKVVYFYLTWLAALACGIITGTIDDSGKVAHTCAFIFLWIFAFNLLVVSFEFSRMLSVAVLFLSLAVVFLGLWLGFLDGLFGFLKHVQPAANHQFYFFIFVTFTLVYLFVFLQTRFNYWIVRRNELLHKHGFLGDVKRYHAQDVKIQKEIPDVFEYLLLRSGSMVLHPRGEDRAIVLDNIIGIQKKEAEVKEILESYAVRIDND
ncbi:MAG: hypothetical protein ABFS86_02000 [Planctomycetota bacterium]